ILLRRLPISTLFPYPTLFRSASSSCGAEPGHGFVVHLEIRINVLHVVIVIKGGYELEDRLRAFLVYGRAGLRTPDGLDGFGLTQRSFQRGRNLADVLEGAGDDVAVLVRLDVLGTGLDRRLHDLVGIAGARGVDDLTDTVEHERDRSRFAKRSARLGEGGADIGSRPVAVVGQGFHNNGDTARAVAFVAHLFIVF